MFRKHLIALSLAALILPSFVTQAQSAEPRTIELRLAALSRGYMQPMRRTAERLAKVPGLESAEMLGFAGDLARFKVTTRLDDKQLAAALKLNLVGASSGVVTLAPEINARARHAEARGPLMEIALRILAEPQPSWRHEGDPLFEQGWELKEKMERLGLSYEALGGVSYKADEYHIEENWQGNGGEYRIWAGNTWEGISVPGDDWGYNEGGETEMPTEADPNSRFVGLKVSRNSWQSSLTWVDFEGLLLTGFDGERSDSDGSGKLFVQHGADWMLDILKAVAAWRVRNPKTSADSAPNGRGWTIFSMLREGDEDNSDIERWDVKQFEPQSIRLSWRDEDGAAIAELTAHYPMHPFYLSAELDTKTLLAANEKLTEEERKKARRLDPGSALKWIVGAEQDATVFDRRRDEARTNSAKILDALGSAVKTHGLDKLCGNLGDAELVKRLGLDIKPVEFALADYTIRKQMLGDVEISVGSSRTGGRLWMLANVEQAKTIRSNQ